MSYQMYFNILFNMYSSSSCENDLIDWRNLAVRIPSHMEFLSTYKNGAFLSQKSDYTWQMMCNRNHSYNKRQPKQHPAYVTTINIQKCE